MKRWKSYYEITVNDAKKQQHKNICSAHSFSLCILCFFWCVQLTPLSLSPWIEQQGYRSEKKSKKDEVFRFYVCVAMWKWRMFLLLIPSFSSLYFSPKIRKCKKWTQIRILQIFCESKSFSRNHHSFLIGNCRNFKWFSTFSTKSS